QGHLALALGHRGEREIVAEAALIPRGVDETKEAVPERRRAQHAQRAVEERPVAELAHRRDADARAAGGRAPPPAGPRGADGRRADRPRPPSPRRPPRAPRGSPTGAD